MSTKSCFSFNHYLQYAVKLCNELYDDGFFIIIRNYKFHLRAVVVAFSVDIKFKDECLVMKQGGYFRHCYCYHPGEAFNGTVSYPFSRDYGLRSRRSFLFDAFVATTYAPVCKPRATSFRGVKMESPLLSLKSFHCPRYITIDALHVFDHGIIKLFLSAWLGKRTHHSLPYSLRQLDRLPWVISKENQENIEQDIANLKLPDQITRKVRSLEDFNIWKADEFRVFALYISLPLLENRIPRALYLHWKLFVKGYKILLKPQVYSGEIEEAEKKLLKFYNDISSLYHPSFCTIKVHYLQHVCNFVRDFGPLNNYSTDRFESVNGKITRSNNAKYQVEKHLIGNI